MSFGFFDPEQPVVVTTGDLPHWFQPGVTSFVTFRTMDSLPADVLRDWLRRKNDWLLRHDINPTAPDWEAHLQCLPLQSQRHFHEAFSEELERYLDAGHGECLLRRPELAQAVAESLRHFDGARYHLGDFVVMPNHVHLLVCPLGAATVTGLCYSWKKFTAGKINRLLGRCGHFWQPESFDHLVRNLAQFDRFRRYIAENPARASLREGEYLLWRRPDLKPPVA
jgi:REP element-mobilizing transposase RayT